MASLDELLHEVRRIEQHRVELTEKRIKSIYKSLAKDLDSFIGEEYIKYADKDGKLFLSYLDSKNKRAKFLEEVVKNVDGISPQVRQELIDLVDMTYEKSYKGIVKAVKEADDTKELLSGTKTLVRPEVLKQAVNNNIEKLTLNAVMEKHRAEIIADIQQTLNVGLMQGDRYETMAKRIQERLGVSYSKASNIARTESHRNIESGLMDGAKETANALEGSDLIYAATWRTMKDQRVRPQQRRKTKKGWVTTMSKSGADHQKMEGVTIAVGEQFQLEPDVFAECPGKSGTARNDCRCRCYLRYRLLTPQEFYKLTGRNITLTKKQEETIKDYTGIYGKQVNAYMNGKTSKITAHEESLIDSLHNILEKTIITEDCVKYRGGGLSVFGDMKNAVLSDPQKAVGMTLTNRGFMSLSDSQKIAKTFSNPDYDKLILYVMDIPKGTKGLDLSALSILDYEKETLLQDHTKFKITKVVEKEDRIVFKCKVLP